MKDNFTFKTNPFDGFKMGSPFVGSKVIAIPEKRLKDTKQARRQLMVINKATENRDVEFMVFDGSELPEALGKFRDKFRDNEEYTLYYFKWNPQKQLSLL